MLRHAQALEMMPDAKAVRQGGIFAVDLGRIRLSSSLGSTGFGIWFAAANPRFLLEPSMLYVVAVTVATVAVVTVDVINVV